MLPSKQRKKVIVHEYKKEPIHLATIPLGLAQSKNNDFRYHIIRNKVGRRSILLIRIGSENQCANILTQSMPPDAG